MAKFQDKQNLKGSKGETGSNVQGAPIRLGAEISMEMLQARKIWKEIFQVMRTRGLQPRLL